MSAPIAAATGPAPAGSAASSAPASSQANVPARVSPVATFLALLAALTSHAPASPSGRGGAPADPGDVPTSPTHDGAGTADVPTAPPSLAALLLALAATPPALAAQPPVAPPAGAGAEPGSTASAIAQAVPKSVPGAQPGGAAVGVAMGVSTAPAGASSAVVGADLAASPSTASRTTGGGTAPLSMTIGAASPPGTAPDGFAPGITTTGAASALETLPGDHSATSTLSPAAGSSLAPSAASALAAPFVPSATSPFVLAQREVAPGTVSHGPLVESAGAPGMRTDTPGLSAAGARLATDAAPALHLVTAGEPVELALLPAGALALSSDAEHAGDEPDERHAHDPGAAVEAAASALGGRVEHARDGVGSAAPAMATAEDVVRQLAPRLAALPRTGRHDVVLRLDPPTLGAVRIEATLQGRELTLHIRADNAGARDLLEQGLPQLRQALEREGVTAGRISIELGLQADTGRPSHGTPFARPVPASVTERPAIEAPRRASLRAVSSAAIDLWV